MKFRADFPRVTLESDVSAAHGPIEALFGGQIDVAIVSSPERDRRLRVRPLFQDEMRLGVKPDGCHQFREFILNKMAESLRRCSRG